MVGYTLNNRSRYKCDYCDHSTYKTWSGVLAHLETHHATEWALVAKKDEEIERLKNRPPKVVEKVVYKDPPAKPEPKQEFWNHGVYCSTCRIAYKSVGIPRGQTIENTPHSNCGTSSLMPVEDVIW